MFTGINLFLVAATLSAVPLPHQLEDGFVERAVEVVVRDDTLNLKYFVGLNEVTMATALERWNVDDKEDLAQKVYDKFQRVLQNQLQANMQIQVDGQIEKLDAAGVEICPKHHFDFVVSYKLNLPSDQTLEIMITDRNFMTYESAARFAFKGVGSTIVNRVNAAPIIIRANRIEFKGMSKEDRLDNCKIVASVITPPTATNYGNQAK